MSIYLIYKKDILRVIRRTIAIIFQDTKRYNDLRCCELFIENVHPVIKYLTCSIYQTLLYRSIVV